MLPLLRGYAPDQTVLFDRGRPISAGAFCGVAADISTRLPVARFAFNLCEGRAEFLLATAAALLARHTLVLPPSRLARTHGDLLDIYPDSYCFVDGPAGASGSSAAHFVVRPELERAHEAPPVALWPPPMVPAAHIVAIMFTSGTTGAPQAHPKTWGAMCSGTQTLLSSFGAPPRGTAILGTVPPQHMFGFETTVMLALQAGTPLLDARPVYPCRPVARDGEAAACGAAAVWLMSTPLQVRAFHRELRVLPHVTRIITATMPLDPDLARAIERDWQIPVEEIFGCTEGGILATRRPAQSRHFLPAAGLVFGRSTAGSPQVSGGHLPQALMPCRPAVAGIPRLCRKRQIRNPRARRRHGEDRGQARVAAGVESGTSCAARCGRWRHVPAIRDATRLAAVVVAPGCAKHEIRKTLADRIDPAFMPRPLILAHSLPRDGNGKLPIGELRALLPARVNAISPSDADRIETLIGSAVVPGDHPALPGHFPGTSYRPGRRAARTGGGTSCGQRIWRAWLPASQIPRPCRATDCSDLACRSLASHLGAFCDRRRRQERRRGQVRLRTERGGRVTAQPAWLAQRERGSRTLIWLIVKVTLLLGRSVGRVLLYPICTYFLLFSGRARRASRAYLRRALARPPGWRDLFRPLSLLCADDPRSRGSAFGPIRPVRLRPRRNRRAARRPGTGDAGACCMARTSAVSTSFALSAPRRAPSR
jgi:acyl-CoA synthetase (AMP-forming)/AMP-acid ligase II